jgi:hypothetical protein
MSMTKTTTNAIDFLAAISGGTEFFEVSGAIVELRSLTFAEVQRLSSSYKDDNAEMAFQALVLGLVAPKLDSAQLEQVRNGKPGPLMKIAQRVMQISGMIEDAENFPGGGSFVLASEQP